MEWRYMDLQTEKLSLTWHHKLYGCCGPVPVPVPFYEHLFDQFCVEMCVALELNVPLKVVAFVWEGLLVRCCASSMADRAGNEKI